MSAMTIRQAVGGDIPQMQRVRMSVRENQLANPTSVEDHDYRAMLRSGQRWVCELNDHIVALHPSLAVTSPFDAE
jgi:hypothetical protein